MNETILKEKLKIIFRIVIFEYLSKYSTCEGLYTLLIQKTEGLIKKFKSSDNFFEKINNSNKTMRDLFHNETNAFFEMIKNNPNTCISKEVLEIVYFFIQIPTSIETYFKNIENYVMNYDENNAQVIDITFLENQKKALDEFRNNIYSKIQFIKESNFFN